MTVTCEPLPARLTDGQRVPGEEPPTRIMSLDVLRGVAVLLVLCHHTLPINQTVVGYHWWLTLKVRQVGWSGVDLFFVLSGFLVGGLLCAAHRRTGKIDPLRFLGRRAFKIYPAFYALLAMTFLGQIYAAQVIEFWPWVGEVCFLQNYVGRVWRHTWSLAVEEHFYVVIAAVMWVASSTGTLDRRRVIVSGCVLVLFSVLTYRCWLMMTVPFNRETHMFATHVRIDSLLFGSLLAYWWHFECDATIRIMRRYCLLWSVAAIACLWPLTQRAYDSPLIHGPGFTLNYLGFGAVMMLGLAGCFSKIERHCRWISVPLVFIGRRSYGIYLVHMAAYHLIDDLLPETMVFDARFFLHAGLSTVLSVALGALMTALIEAPALRLRERCLPATIR